MQNAIELVLDENTQSLITELSLDIQSAFSRRQVALITIARMKGHAKGSVQYDDEKRKLYFLPEGPADGLKPQLPQGDIK